MKCAACGHDNEEGVRFCGSCGAPQEAPAAASRARARTIFQGSGSIGSAPGPVVRASTSKGAPRSQASASVPQAAGQPAPAPAQVVAPLKVSPPLAAAMPQRPSQPVANVPATATELNLTGTILNGRYEVGDRLGEGGFGAVFRATQTKMGRECALKVLHPRMARDPQVIGRFRREAQAASVLKDGHTVQIYDFDQTPEGVFYLAMELVRGVSLHEEIAKGPMAAERVARVLDGIASSLGEAHHHGVVHRDIKPENIFLEPRPNDPDYAKVLDFGIAKITAASNAGLQGPALTAAGQTLGTVEYMSPEQLMGLELDGRSDLYAIGILAYEMLTGDLPFQVKTAGEMISAHLKTQPVPPSQRAPQAGIPPAMDAVVLRLMQKKRENRYANTAELQADLRRLSDPSFMPASAKAAPAPLAKPAPKPVAPARPGLPLATVVLIAGAALALLGAIIAFLLWFSSRASAAEPTAAARLAPSEMQLLVGLDVPQLRAAGPPETVKMIVDAVRDDLAGVGADPDKIGQVAFAADNVDDDQKMRALLVADLPLDAAKMARHFKKPSKPATYGGVKFRRGVESWGVLPGDRLVVTKAMKLEQAIDLNQGKGTPLVDGAAADLLRRVGVVGGRGPAIFGWAKVPESARSEASKAAPDYGKVKEVAASLGVGAQGADVKGVGRCPGPAEAQAVVAATRKALAEAAKEPVIGMLGLKPYLQLVHVDQEQDLAQVSLSLTREQYVDILTRMTGLLRSSLHGRDAAGSDAAEKPAKPTKAKPAKKPAR